MADVLRKPDSEVIAELERTLGYIREPKISDPKLAERFARINLDYARGVAFGLNVRIDYETMTIVYPEDEASPPEGAQE